MRVLACECVVHLRSEVFWWMQTSVHDFMCSCLCLSMNAHVQCRRKHECVETHIPFVHLCPCVNLPFLCMLLYGLDVWCGWMFMLLLPVADV